MKVYKIIKVPKRVSMFASGKYQLKYPIDSTVTAPEGTLGIMCFSSRKYVLEFVKMFCPIDLTIIEVEGIGKPIRPKRVAWKSLESQIDKFYEARKQCKKYHPPINPPKGTICFQKVKVLN